MKTRNLTKSSLRNDPINRRMQGFSFRVFEDEVEVQEVISPKYLNQIKYWFQAFIGCGND